MYKPEMCQIIQYAFKSICKKNKVEKLLAEYNKCLRCLQNNE